MCETALGEVNRQPTRMFVLILVLDTLPEDEGKEDEKPKSIFFSSLNYGVGENGAATGGRRRGGRGPGSH